MDEIELSKKQERGAQAEALLRNELLKETLNYLKSEYISAWLNTRPQDAEYRERFWQAAQIVGRIHDHITKFVTDGRIASKDLASVKYLKR